MKKMWGLLVLALLIAVGIQIAGYFLKSQEAFTTDNLIRLHVIANSDSSKDQAIKMQVKDELVYWLSPKLAVNESAEESRKVLAENLNTIERFVCRELQNLNQNYGAKVYLGEFYFPTRKYGELVLPDGRYQALQVVLGEGQGKNWWCVLYPPLCLKGVSKDLSNGPHGWFIADKWKKAWRKESISLPQKTNTN